MGTSSAFARGRRITSSFFVGRAGVQFLPSAVQLHDAGQVVEFIASMHEDGIRPMLVVIDTLARCFVGGDENSAAAMGLFIEAAEDIRRATDATVLLVHHTNKMGEVERGSIALRGAVDTMLMAKKTGRKTDVQLACVKMKDAEEFDDMYFRFMKRGESGVMVPMEAPRKKKEEAEATSTLTRPQRAALDVLPVTGLSHGEWRQNAINVKVAPGSFAKIRNTLLDNGYVFQDEDGVYRRTEEDAPASIGSIPPRSGDTEILTEAPSKET
jgi:hypothetical protein